jgi:hypothetical protein
MASDRTCPSARCEPGATLIGAVCEDGTVAYMSPQARVDAHFATLLGQRGSPERRFRFAAPCVEGACSQWTGSRCGVIDRVLAAGDEDGVVAPDAAALPRCGIRASCRWFAQVGASACRVCPLVVTDAGAPAQA